MLQLFRTNQFFAIFFLLIYAVVLRMFVFIYPLDWKPTNIGYFSQFIYNAIGSNTILANIISLLLVVLQALMINSMVNNYKMARGITFFPAMSYILLASAIPEYLALSPLLLANTFVIAALSQMVDLFKKPDVSSQLFNVGFWVAVASLFYFGTGVYLILGILSLVRLRSIKMNELVILFIGFGVPFFLVGTYQLWIDGLATFWSNQIIGNLSLFDLNIELKGQNYLKIGFYLFLIVWAVLNSGAYYLKTSIQTRKIIGVVFTGLFIASLSVIYQKNVNIEHLAIINVPLAIFLSLNLLLIKNRAITEFLHLVLLLIIIIMQYQEQLINLLVTG